MKKITVFALASLLGACSMLPQKNLSGTYKGTIACADCEKIEAELTLNKDGTYQYDTVYFKKGKTYPFSEKGTFNQDKTKQGVIYLTQSGNLALKVYDKFVEFCNTNGESMKDQNQYRLDKISH